MISSKNKKKANENKIFFVEILPLQKKIKVMHIEQGFLVFFHFILHGCLFSLNAKHADFQTNRRKKKKIGRPHQEDMGELSP